MQVSFVVTVAVRDAAHAHGVEYQLHNELLCWQSRAQWVANTIPTDGWHNASENSTTSCSLWRNGIRIGTAYTTMSGKVAKAVIYLSADERKIIDCKSLADARLQIEKVV